MFFNLFDCVFDVAVKMWNQRCRVFLCQYVMFREFFYHVCTQRDVSHYYYVCTQRDVSDYYYVPRDVSGCSASLVREEQAHLPGESMGTVPAEQEVPADRRSQPAVGRLVVICVLYER